MERNVKFYKDVKQTLEEEVGLLTGIIQKNRQAGDYGTYRNLIIALKEVLKIYDDIVNYDSIEEPKIKKEETKVYNIDNNFKIDKDCNIEDLLKSITENLKKSEINYYDDSFDNYEFKSNRDTIDGIKIEDYIIKVINEKLLRVGQKFQ